MGSKKRRGIDHNLDNSGVKGAIAVQNWRQIRAGLTTVGEELKISTED